MSVLQQLIFILKLVCSLCNIFIIFFYTVNSKFIIWFMWSPKSASNFYWVCCETEYHSTCQSQILIYYLLLLPWKSTLGFKTAFKLKLNSGKYNYRHQRFFGSFSFYGNQILSTWHRSARHYFRIVKKRFSFFLLQSMDFFFYKVHNINQWRGQLKFLKITVQHSLSPIFFLLQNSKYLFA